mgnify:CR=1 FL=1
MAQKLGEDDPEQIVALRFYEEIEADQGAYEAERLKAGNADAFLREYLGTASYTYDNYVHRTLFIEERQRTWPN